MRNRELDTDSVDPAVEVAEIVTEIEGEDTAELSTVYERVDGVLDYLFSNPPSPGSQLQIEFSYETYRIRTDRTAQRSS